MSLRFITNHLADRASAFAVISGATESGDPYELMGGHRGTFWKSEPATSVVSVGYSLAADLDCDYLVAIRADKMVTKAGAQILGLQKSSGGSWSAIAATLINSLAASNLTGYRSQDLVLDVSSATNLRGFAIEFDSINGTDGEAMMFSGLIGGISFAFTSPPSLPISGGTLPMIDIPEAQRWFKPQQSEYEYETEKSFKLFFKGVRASEAAAFKALPMLLKWPLVLYDTAGDWIPWKLEHCIIEGWTETVIEKNNHTFDITFRRLKHYV